MTMNAEQRRIFDEFWYRTQTPPVMPSVSCAMAEVGKGELMGLINRILAAGGVMEPQPRWRGAFEAGVCAALMANPTTFDVEKEFDAYCASLPGWTIKGGG